MSTQSPNCDNPEHSIVETSREELSRARLFYTLVIVAVVTICVGLTHYKESLYNRVLWVASILIASLVAFGVSPSVDSYIAFSMGMLSSLVWTFADGDVLVRNTSGCFCLLSGIYSLVLTLRGEHPDKNPHILLLCYTYILVWISFLALGNNTDGMRH